MEDNNQIIKQGFLWKQSQLIKAWRKKFFILRNFKLEYREPGQETPTLGTINLDANTQIEEDLTSSNMALAAFSIKNKSVATHIYYLQAVSLEEKTNWIKAIRDCIKSLSPVDYASQMPIVLAGIEIEFTTSFQIKSNKDSHTEYGIELKDQNNCIQQIIHRFSEFYNLHKLLMKKYPNYSFPPFPPKTLITSIKDIEIRKKMFAQYFRILFEKPSIFENDKDIHIFFQIDAMKGIKPINTMEETIEIEESLETKSRRHLKLAHSSLYIQGSVGVNKLKQRIEELQSQDETKTNGFDKEFEYIEQKTLSDSKNLNHYSVALHRKNYIKNRYSNVLPFDSKRVILSKVDGSDYINASWIDGLTINSQKNYIAAQAPITSTLPDFWRMIEETEVNVIVMITKLIEMEKVKCVQYWPNDCQETCEFGPYSISMNSKENCDIPFLTIRNFTFRNLNTSNSRSIIHFQYSAWPDHGIPQNEDAFLELITRANTARISEKPILVHCSAGIGRTGTFCVVDSILNKIKFDIENKNEINFNIVETTLHMRSQRPGMIQTKEQYTFCYLTIQAAIEKLQLNNN